MSELFIAVSVAFLAGTVCVVIGPQLGSVVAEAYRAIGLARRSIGALGATGKLSPSKMRTLWVPPRLRKLSVEAACEDAVVSLTYVSWLAGLFVAVGLVAFTGVLYLGTAGLLFALLAPAQLIALRRRSLRTGLLRQLPAALDLIASSLSSGMSLCQSFEYAGGRLGGTTGAYLTGIAREQGVGVGVDEALANLRIMLDMRELDTVVIGLTIQRKAGGNLAEMLESMAVVLKQRLALQRKLEVMTAQTRLSGRVIGILPVGVAVIVGLVDPGFFAPMLSTAFGWLLLGLAFAAEIAGFVVVSRIAGIEI